MSMGLSFSTIIFSFVPSIGISELINGTLFERVHPCLIKKENYQAKFTVYAFDITDKENEIALQGLTDPYKDGNYLLNPSVEELKDSELDLVVEGT